MRYDDDTTAWLDRILAVILGMSGEYVGLKGNKNVNYNRAKSAGRAKRRN